jgi:hypothetical protein
MSGLLWRSALAELGRTSWRLATSLFLLACVNNIFRRKIKLFKFEIVVVANGEVT